ncbi:DUF1007 family protein [Sulfitobacter aestuariivivens]|uniref:DUF1007 family protein n=1 Tax=Sulfitobacter aestuariivivens TaxID=2766981 RepID=A0A927D7X1_9RHOB|nr:DUF1007 family protein [Sulfitobacter aestuariivivens]MBD3665788.1 DUF1007 family protein [Sulfitobacter aestuariivivens]
MKKTVLFALLVAAPPLDAHPHIFIDTGLEVIVDEEGHVTYVKVTWTYDALYSLLVTEDKGMDLDGDGALSPEEEDALAGFDMAWIPGFNGDLVAHLDDAPLALGGPEAATAEMIDGRIITTHMRAVAGTPALGDATLSLKPYDETFYTAYDVTGTIAVTGLDGCDIRKVEPDVDAELANLQYLLGKLSQDQDAIEMGFPEVGESFATDVQVTCAA